MSSISVIIPNYNRAHCLGLTIENMINQSRRPDEVILVDDGSTDDSINIVKSFGKHIYLFSDRLP